MTPLVENLNFLLALGGVLSFLLAGILLVDMYRARALEQLIRAWGLIGALIVTGTGTVMALIYSEVFGFVPCGLCWLQRMFLMPQVALLLGAIYWKDAAFPRYGIILSSIGLVVGLYQHFLQMGGTEFVKCPTAGAGADCAKRIMFEFGFMTYPLLSVASFAFLIVLYLYLIRSRG